MSCVLLIVCIVSLVIKLYFFVYVTLCYIQGPYCTSKAALHMMYKCMSPELLQQDVLLGSIDPGVVDTPMQGDIRGFNGPKDQFPTHNVFLDLHSSGQLQKPDDVAVFFHWLLAEVGDEEFIAHEWDGMDKDDERWKKYCSL